MNSDWLITPLVLAIAAGIVFLADRTRAIVFHTSVARDGIRVRLFGKIPVVHIPLDQIQEVERQSWFHLFIEGSLKGSSYAGAGWWFRKPVVIWRRDGGPFLISPRDPEGFINEVRRYLELGQPAA